MSQKYPQASTVSADGTKSERTGREHYSHIKADQRRDKRRNEAIERQVIYEELTIADRLNLAKSRPGRNKRELARLEKLLIEQSAKQGQARVIVTAPSDPKAQFPLAVKPKRTPKSKVVKAAKQQNPSKS